MCFSLTGSVVTNYVFQVFWLSECCTNTTLFRNTFTYKNYKLLTMCFIVLMNHIMLEFSTITIYFTSYIYSFICENIILFKSFTLLLFETRLNISVWQARIVNNKIKFLARSNVMTSTSFRYQFYLNTMFTIRLFWNANKYQNILILVSK